MSNTAKSALCPPEVTCAVARGGQVLYAASGNGVRPLLTCYRQRPQDLAGAEVADLVVGKAAAILLVLGGAAEVYGQVMSRPAIDYLEAHGILHSCGEQVPLILNRSGDGMCPLEASVVDIEDPQQGYAALLARIEQLMKGQ